jgi:hypothetical protein
MKLKIERLVVLVSVTTLLGCHPPATVEPEQTFKQLSEGYEAAYRKFKERRNALKDEKEQKKLSEKSHPRLTYVPQFERLMKEHPADPAALDAAAWLVSRTGYDDPKWNQDRAGALAFIKANHIRSPKLEDAVTALRYAEPADKSVELLRLIARDNPERRLRGLSTLMLGERLSEKSPSEAEAALKEVIATYPDLKLKRTFKEIAGRYIYEIENLAVGRPAPNVEGEDVDGGKLSLRDYRGKVVLLSFFGDW